MRLGDPPNVDHDVSAPIILVAVILIILVLASLIVCTSASVADTHVKACPDQIDE